MQAAISTAKEHGVLATCAAFDIPLATYYRHRAPMYGPRPRRPSPPRRLADAERQAVLDVLHEPRFVDLAPAEVHATLLEEARYLCSVRTMHRILAENAELRERRDQLRHPAYAKPELLATGPNQLWTWDITKLHGPAKWTYFYLYVILDVFSRYVVGWMVAHRESASLAQKLLAETYEREGIQPGQLTVHADRGASMTSKPVAFLLADLGVTKTHSRPHVSNDNPYSEAQFKTLKYRPDFPERFGAAEDARAHCKDFFDWSNHEHHHSALGMLTPSDVHHGRVEQRIAERQDVYDRAFAAHPERFPHGRPIARRPPREVWINKPTPPPALPESSLATSPSGGWGESPSEAQRAAAQTSQPPEAPQAVADAATPRAPPAPSSALSGPTLPGASSDGLQVH
jgi:putative transposase